MSENQKDYAGRDYISPDNKPAAHGVQVKIPDGYGNYNDGTMVGGYVVPNKK